MRLVKAAGDFYPGRAYRQSTYPRSLSEPPRDTRHGLAHFVGRTRIGKANELMAMNRIEVDAGGRRDVRLFQHLFGKLETVGGELRDIGVEVKRAVGGQELVETGLRQSFDQNAAVLLIAALYVFHFLAAFERGLGGNLRQRRHRD